MTGEHKLTDLEKYQKILARNAAYKKNRRLNDPEYVQKCKDYDKNYYQKMRNNAIKQKQELEELSKI
jgi:hypothetical protein